MFLQSPRLLFACSALLLLPFACGCLEVKNLPSDKFLLGDELTKELSGEYYYTNEKGIRTGVTIKGSKGRGFIKDHGDGENDWPGTIHVYKIADQLLLFSFYKKRWFFVGRVTYSKTQLVVSFWDRDFLEKNPSALPQYEGATPPKTTCTSRQLELFLELHKDNSLYATEKAGRVIFNRIGS